MCTGVRFTDDKGNLYFGRNLDWSEGYGETIVVTPRNHERKFAFEGEPKQKQGVIGMAIVVDDIPLYFDCYNENGLAIAGLNFPGYAQYETDAVEGKTNVAAYEFPLWVTSNFTTVDEVEAALADVAIVGKQVNEHLPVSLLHWIIGDKDRAIVVEYMADGIHIHHDDVDVLTNQPTFDWHRENLRSYLNVKPDYVADTMWGKADLTPYGSGGQMRGLPGDCYSPSRFVRVAYYNNHYPVQSGEQANVSRLFHTLLSVMMVDGGALMGNNQFEKTVYTGGYSQATKTYYYNTYENFDIVHHSMDEVDLDGTELTAF